MNIKVTVVGRHPRAEGGSTTPPASEGAAPGHAVRSGHIPTAMPGARSKTPSMEGRASAAQASALPGVQRKALDVPMADLVGRFPQMGWPALQAAQGLLAGVYPNDMGAARWVHFGTDVQEELSRLVKQRLAVAQNPAARAVSQHLGRLQSLLSNVLDALDSGFLKRRPDKVWAQSQPEVDQLEGLLRTGCDTLAGQLDVLEAALQPAQACAARLEATSVAATYLLDHVPAEMGSLLLARLASLTASQAMLQEHTWAIAQDRTHLQELVVLIKDGVLLKLPAVHTQLAGVVGKPTETQRFITVEKISDMLLTLKNRKNT